MALNHHQILCYNDKFLYLRSSYNITTTTLFKIMMNKYQIGTNAGIVWRILSDNAHWDYEKLKEVSGLSDRDLNAAIGWLAREKKIYCSEDNGEWYISNKQPLGFFSFG